MEERFVELKRALERLEKNPDFIAVILDGYMKDKALDSVSLLAEERVKSQGLRGNVMEDLVSISNLGYYFKMIKALGTSIEDSMKEKEGE